MFTVAPAILGANAAPADVYATFDPANKSVNVTLSNANLTESNNATPLWGVARSTLPVAMKCRWTYTVVAAPDGVLVGIDNGTNPVTTAVGLAAGSWAYANTGLKYTGGTDSPYGAAYGVGDVIDTLYDPATGTLSFRLNGVDQGVAFTGLTGTIRASSGFENQVITANFGASAFATPDIPGYQNGIFTGPSVPIYATWDPADVGSDSVLSGGNLVLTSTSNVLWNGILGNIAKAAGKWVFEVTGSVAPTTVMIGASSVSLTGYPGNPAAGINGALDMPASQYFVNAMTAHGAAPAGSQGPWMMAIDIDAGKAWLAVGSVWANGGDPAAGTNPCLTFAANTPLYPFGSVNGIGASATLNAGQKAFSNAVPAGFNAGWYT